jgi:hypothetical protein
VAYSSRYAWMRSFGSSMSTLNFMPGMERRSVVYPLLVFVDIVEGFGWLVVLVVLLFDEGGSVLEDQQQFWVG